ncbi:uroporphyrinogen decarboxylase [Polyangium aurulentum]|uniref:uroporphyrinogen decarboxylase n=1 Tax=Polyangium aurulentum TaxID=2567896 RepID=UPI0010AEB32D|nr:uroporphyrinogen decarboxylase [Polyangium aurulentum]UQA61126.1 uroporphyrinogen decarboxylase [Polyangium aurulentum]
MFDRFLRACRREPTDVTPVWFMRQAGRYMAEYRAIREKHTLIEICKTPELALTVTLQPLRLGVDAAILFADILLLLEPMGAPFSFEKGEGPVIHAPVRERADIDRLRVIDPEEGLGYVLEAVRLIRRELEGKTPLIGFAGAPFTIASYLVEGGRSSDYFRTKQLMWGEPEAFSLLMSKIAEVTRRYLRAQVEAGAQAVQLFDSWAGALSPADYKEHVAPHVRHILGDLETTGVPVIHFGTNTATLLEAQRDAGGTVIGVDFRTPLGDAWKRIGYDHGIQGNLDPLLLCAPREVAAERARAILAEAGGRPGHIFNLGHGIVPQTPVDNVQAMVDVVHAFSASEAGRSA